MTKQKVLEETIVPFFEDRVKKIKFIPNPRDKGAYQVLIGEKAHLYLTNGTVKSLSHELISTDHIERVLDNDYPRISATLKENSLKYEDLHIAILKVRVKEQEQQIRHMHY